MVNVSTEIIREYLDTICDTLPEHVNEIYDSRDGRLFFIDLNNERHTILVIIERLPFS